MTSMVKTLVLVDLFTVGGCIEVGPRQIFEGVGASPGPNVMGGGPDVMGGSTDIAGGGLDAVGGSTDIASSGPDVMGNEGVDAGVKPDSLPTPDPGPKEVAYFDPCETDMDCGGDFPICHPDFLRCVEGMSLFGGPCEEHIDCAPSAHYCNAWTHKCVECMNSSMCGGYPMVCDDEVGKCVEKTD